MEEMSDANHVEDQTLTPSGPTLTNGEVPVSDRDDQFDYSRLYGDLCRKLLSTPVTEIFSEASTGNAINTTAHDITSGIPQSILATESQESLLGLPSNTYAMSPGLSSEQKALFGGIYANSGVFDSKDSARKPTASQKSKNLQNSGNPKKTPDIPMPTDEKELGLYLESMDGLAETHQPIDIQKLVDEFRITLERYGVSQRFAARFIMQDTSQGNLSFLMEKGRVKTWEELSPRGRIPYIKMKAWLESKELQLNTLHMLKYSQEMRRNSPKESYNRRERFSMFQLNVLCRLFEENPNPPMNIRNAVAERLNIPLDRVNVWFQNQRARGFPARRIFQQHSGMYSEETLKSDIAVTEELKLIAKSGKFPSVAAAITATPPQASPTQIVPPVFPFGAVTDTQSSYLTQPFENQAPETPRSYLTQVKNETPEFDNNTHVTNNIQELLRNAQFRSSPTMSSATQLTPPNRSTHSPTIREEPCGEAPLDLSASNCSVSSGNTSGNTSDNEDRLKSHATKASSTGSTSLSGASKRKRGSKPQQIIPKSIKVERGVSPECSDVSNGVGVDHSQFQKRRRVSSSEDTIGKRKNLEFISDKIRTKEYDYVIKTEPDVGHYSEMLPNHDTPVDGANDKRLSGKSDRKADSATERNRTDEQGSTCIKGVNNGDEKSKRETRLSDLTMNLSKKVKHSEENTQSEKNTRHVNVFKDNEDESGLGNGSTEASATKKGDKTSDYKTVSGDCENAVVATPDTLLKAMCASIAMEKRSGSSPRDSNKMMEPDLD